MKAGVLLVCLLCACVLVAEGYPHMRRRTTKEKVLTARGKFLDASYAMLLKGGVKTRGKELAVRTHHEGEEGHHEGEEGVHPEDPMHELLETYDENGDDLLDRVEFESMYDDIIGVHEDDHADHAEGEEGHHEEEGAEEGNAGRTVQTREFVELCPEPTSIFDERDVDNSGTLDEDELMVVASDFLVMLGAGCAVEEDAHADHGDDGCEAPSTSEKWGYGFLAVFVISIISIIGITLIPVNNKKVKGRIIYGLIAFAVGTLFGDALLHLLPIVWGIHGHEEEEGEHSEDDEKKEEQLILWKGIVVFAGLLLFLIIETFVHHISHRVNHRYKLKQQRSRSDLELQSTVANGKSTDSSDVTEDSFDEQFYDSRIVPDKPADSWREIRAVGWLNLVSDAVHNLVDGLAIGAAFSVSLSTGLATSIAVALHEIPQEFADFGILLHAGFSKRWAIIFNFLCSLFAFLGVTIGLSIGEAADDASIWLLALTAGGFLYIALVDMMPIVLAKPKWRRLSAAAFIINVGFWIMFLLAWFEEDFGGCGGH